MTPGRFEPGTVIVGRYRIESVLGEGGMGTVYRARRLDLPMTVALKTLRPERADDAEFVARFVREGEALAKMRHPHVVDILDVGTHGGTPFLVMALLEGESLSERLATRGPFDQTDLVDLIVPVLAALSTAHARGIVHRDIKPDNIVIERTPNGLEHPRLVDFGISRLDAPLDGQRLTQSDRIVGTPLYMAPEQAQHARAADPRSDQYALGVTLYECASGGSPFEVATLGALLLAASQGRTRPLHRVAPHLDPGFCALVHRAMDPNPDRRFEDIDALARALLPYASRGVRSHWAPAFRAPISDAPGAVSFDTATTIPAPPTGPTTLLPPSSIPLVETASPVAPAPLRDDPIDDHRTTTVARPQPRPPIPRGVVAAAALVSVVLCGMAFTLWQRGQEVAAPLRTVPTTRLSAPAPPPPPEVAPRPAHVVPAPDAAPDAGIPPALAPARPTAPAGPRPRSPRMAPLPRPPSPATAPESPREREGSNGAPIRP